MYDVPTVSSGNSILDHFNQVIHVLSMNPGNMEEYLRPVCDMIRNSSDTTEIANDVAESLFNQVCGIFGFICLSFFKYYIFKLFGSSRRYNLWDESDTITTSGLLK